MKKVQILGTVGSKYNTSDGLKTAIGNAEHRVGSVAWCDGEFLLGGQQSSSRVAYVPEGSIEGFIDVFGGGNYQFSNFNEELEVKEISDMVVRNHKNQPHFFTYNTKFMFLICRRDSILLVDKFDGENSKLISSFQIKLPVSEVTVVKFDVNEADQLIGQFYNVTTGEGNYHMMFINSIDSAVSIIDKTDKFRQAISYIKNQFKMTIDNLISSVKQLEMTRIYEKSVTEYLIAEYVTSKQLSVPDGFNSASFSSGIAGIGFSLPITTTTIVQPLDADIYRLINIQIDNVQMDFSDYSISFKVSQTMSNLQCGITLARPSGTATCSWTRYNFDDKTSEKNNGNLVQTPEISGTHGNVYINYSLVSQYLKDAWTIVKEIKKVTAAVSTRSEICSVAITGSIDFPEIYEGVYSSLALRAGLRYIETFASDHLSLDINVDSGDEKEMEIPEIRQLNDGYLIERTGQIKNKTSRCVLKHNGNNVADLSIGNFCRGAINNPGEFPERILQDYTQLFVEEIKNKKMIVLFVGYGSSLWYTIFNKTGESIKTGNINSSINYRMPIIKLRKNKIKSLLPELE